MILVLAYAIGIVAGLRSMTAPAAIAFAAVYLGLPVAATPLAFMGWPVVAWLLAAAAIGECYVDTRPATPSRTVPLGVGARLASGALSGATLGVGHDQLVIGLLGGLVGALVGTFAGSAARAQLAGRFGRDLPAALIEDAVAIAAAALIVAFALAG